MASLARTVASITRPASKPLPLPPGSSSGFTRRARSAVDGWVDGMGWDGVNGTEDQMGPSIFFIFLGV